MEDGGKTMAIDVTGPNGDYVKGAPNAQVQDGHDEYGW